jgi:hypothetical protein
VYDRKGRTRSARNLAGSRAWGRKRDPEHVIGMDMEDDELRETDKEGAATSELEARSPEVKSD